MKGYVTRDKTGYLTLFNNKPYKRRDEWLAPILDIIGEIDDSDLPAGVNPQWEDEEPIEVEILIKTKDVVIKTKDVKPIPLTAEILKKNGFEFQQDYDCYVDEEEYIFISLPTECDGAQIDIKDAGGETGYMNFIPAYRKYLYVHELQQVLRLCGHKEFADNFKI